MVVSTASLTEIRNNCEQTFTKYKEIEHWSDIDFLQKKQQQNETLRQFWNALTGLAARCEFEQQTESLIMDAFI